MSWSIIKWPTACQSYSSFSFNPHVATISTSQGCLGNRRKPRVLRGSPSEGLTRLAPFHLKGGPSTTSNRLSHEEAHFWCIGFIVRRQDGHKAERARLRKESSSGRSGHTGCILRGRQSNGWRLYQEGHKAPNLVAGGLWTWRVCAMTMEVKWISHPSTHSFSLIGLGNVMGDHI